MDIVHNVLESEDSSTIKAKEAKKIIKEALQEDDLIKEIRTLEKVDIPEYKKKNKPSKTAKKTIKKTDYLKKTKANIENGLLGEQLVIDYERERLINLGRPDLADEIEWISQKDDSKGYDIISFDIINKNKIQKRHIEVKSTEENATKDFYISKNEIKAMNELKNQYFIYRIYKLKTRKPKLFILEYEDFKNKIKLEVENYIAKFKEE